MTPAAKAFRSVSILALGVHMPVLPIAGSYSSTILKILKEAPEFSPPTA
jgi:hypothetical protein